MKKRLWTNFVLIVVLAIGICTLAACVVTPEPEPEIPPEEPVDNTLTYLSDLSKALAETAAMNPEDGFLMDLAANVAWNFKDPEKASLYNWSYGLVIKANVFVDGETRQGMMIELTDTYPGRYTDEQKASGEDVLFGLYNTTDENLYVKAGKNASYHFDRVGVSTALKSVLKANGVNLDFNLKDTEVGTSGTIGEFLNAAMPLLSSVFDKVEKDGNNYVLDFKYSKLYAFLEEVLKKADIDLSALPEAVTNVLPKEMTFRAVVKTDGKIITGIDVRDAVMETADGAGDGTFNMTSDFMLFGAPAETLDVEAAVAKSLKDIPATKILNVNTHGDIEFEKIVTTETPTDPGTETPAAAAETTKTVTRTISWKLRANLDLFKLIEKNFIFDDEIFNDNFLHLQLSLDGEPVLDLAYAPENLDTTDFIVIAGLKKLLNELIAPINMDGSSVGLGDLLYNMAGVNNLSLPIDTTALGYMISGKGGKAEVPVPATTWNQPAIYEALSADAGSGEAGGEVPGTETPAAPEIPTGIEGIIDLVKKIVTVGAGEMNVNLEELFQALKLDASVTKFIDDFTKDANNVAFRNNAFEFAKPANAEYDTTEELKKGKYNAETGAHEARDLTFAGQIGLASAIEFETDEGFLNVMRADGNQGFHMKTDRITLEQLNHFVGNTGYYARFTGHDFDGASIDETHDDFGVTKVPNMAMITGYIGLDPTLIGVMQTIEVVTGFPDQSGLITMLMALIPTLSDYIDLGGFDLSIVENLLGGLKFGSFKADVILSEAVARADLYDKTTGESLDATKVYDIYNTGKVSEYGIRASITYLPNAAYPDKLTVSAQKDSDLTDTQQMVRTDFYLESMPFETVAVGGGKYGLSGQGDQTIRIVYRGMEVVKTYRFAPIEDAVIKANRAGQDYVLQGTEQTFKGLADLFTIAGVYTRGTADPSDDLLTPKLSLSEINAATFDFVNFEEITGMKRSKIIDLSKDKFTLANPGVAEIRVNMSGVYMGTVYLAVLPMGTNASFSDIAYETVTPETGTSTVTFRGNFSFELNAALPENPNARKIRFQMSVLRNGTSVSTVDLSINGVKAQSSGFVELTLPAGQTSFTLPFELPGMEAGVNNLVCSMTIQYLINDTSLVTLNGFPCFTGLAHTGFNFTYYVKKGALIRNDCVEFYVQGVAGKYQIKWNAAAKTYLFQQTGKENLAAAVGVYDADGNPIEGGIAADGKISQSGTLRISVTYGGVTYKIEKTIT